MTTVIVIGLILGAIVAIVSAITGSDTTGKAIPGESNYDDSDGYGDEENDDDEDEHYRPGFTTIEITYIDGGANLSQRTLEVWAVNREYIEGWCQKVQAKRTFRIDRVIKDITDTGTGEVMPVRKWAALARKNPLNGKVKM